jgi:hypothetical protein
MDFARFHSFHTKLTALRPFRSDKGAANLHGLFFFWFYLFLELVNLVLKFPVFTDYLTKCTGNFVQRVHIFIKDIDRRKVALSATVREIGDK